VVQWSYTQPDAVAAFEAWSAARGYGYSGPPAAADLTDRKFRHWLQWRNDNLAEFVDEVRARALAVNPGWAFVTEVYPIDYLDSVWTGLEPSVLKRASNSIVVWELDGLSDDIGMEYSGYEDFSNLLAMAKVARAIDRGRPGWGFSYGNKPLDAGLVMGAALTAGLAPFETKTPIMTDSVGADFRTRWFEFVRDNGEALLESGRAADAGVWFSPGSKAFHDFAQGGIYGMYLDLEAPPGAASWWAVLPELSLRETDHLAGWRGAAYALNQMHVPYKAVVDPGDPARELQGLSLVWLPSVPVLSEASAQLLRDFVAAGGTLFATGLAPGILDEHGEARAQSNLADVFGFPAGAIQGARMQRFGEGVAIYRPDLKGVDFFETGGEAGAAARKERQLGQVEQIVRIHTPDRIIADEAGEGIHLELSEAGATSQHVFVLNYSGLQKPLVERPVRVPFHYRPPDGCRVTGAEVRQPGAASLSGSLPVARSGECTWMVEPLVEQFAMVTFQLAAEVPAGPGAPPELQFATPEREEAVDDAFAFLLNRMRHAAAAPPHEYGIHTNLIDNNHDTTVYTGGHHVTDEHMGLFLRVAALLQDEARFGEAMQFVREVLFSRGYHVLAWSMHKDKLMPFLQPDTLNGQAVWMTANAPLDDLRTVRGMFDGAAAFGQSETRALAGEVLDGLYWTSVTDRLRGLPAAQPGYPGGLFGFSWDWEDHDDATLTPPAAGTGLGRLGSDLIPVDYQDLGTLVIGAKTNPRLRSVLAAAVDLMLAAEIPGSPGLFYNGLAEGGVWTGDFEYQGERRGNNLKVIQELWTALHLARAAEAEPCLLDAGRRQAAAAAALRSYNFFKGFYEAQGGRVPEYLTFAGTDVPDGDTGNNLLRGTENLFEGEARIYAQLARLALLMDDGTFAAGVIENKILTDRITDPGDPRFGLIGASTAGAGDAEAFNVLEAMLTLCLEAQPEAAPPVNNPPVANPDTIHAGLDTPALIPPVDLLGNDTDPDDDVLVVSAVDEATAQGGTLAARGSRWLYTPPAGFVGTDTFNYTVTDGAESSSAAVSIEVSEGGGIALEITVDGDLADWPAGHFMVGDPDDISGAANQLDLRELHLTVQDGKLYVAYVNDGPVVYNWGYMLFFDTDLDASTGYEVGDIGAEFVLEGNAFQSYTGNGEDWSWQVTAVASPLVNGEVAELAIPLSALGGADPVRITFVGDNTAYPGGSGEDCVPDVDGGFPDGYVEYRISSNTGAIGPAPGPPVTPPERKRVGIVYSETAMADYWDEFAYYQLYMGMQYQCAMAGVPYDLLDEAALADAGTLSGYAAVVIPLLEVVTATRRAGILDALEQSVADGLSIITSGWFLAFDPAWQDHPGFEADLAALLGVQQDNYYGPVAAEVVAGDVTHPAMAGYHAGEVIRSYDEFWTTTFRAGESTGRVLCEYRFAHGNEPAVHAVTTPEGCRHVHFASEQLMQDTNVLWSALQWVLFGDQLPVALRLGRERSLFFARNDMDQSQFAAEVPLVHEPLLDIITEWKDQHGFVGSYYVNIGNDPANGAFTDWAVSGPLYHQYRALGSEIGTHSYTHPHETASLTAAELDFEFRQSVVEIEAELGIDVPGGAVPGMPESPFVIETVEPWLDYLSGRSAVADTSFGYAAAFGRIRPGFDMFYFCLNTTPDYSLIGYLGHTAEEARQIWLQEYAGHHEHAPLPVIHWLWHDYGPVQQEPGYTREMFDTMIANAAANGSEFVTGIDLFQRIEALRSSTLKVTPVDADSVTVEVAGNDVGRHCLALPDGIDITAVSGWYAYHQNKLYLPKDGGVFTIDTGGPAAAVTRVMKLPPRAELLSLQGDGTVLDFTFNGEGEVSLALNDAHGPLEISGADAVVRDGAEAVLTFDTAGPHAVSVDWLDSDNDLLPDDWETAYGLDPDKASDAAGDLDGDGRSNLQEWISGHSPVDPNDFFAVAVTEADAAFHIAVDGKAGRTYTLQRSTSLHPGSWSDQEAVGPLASDQPVLFVDPGPPGGNAVFYRVKVRRW